MTHDVSQSSENHESSGVLGVTYTDTFMVHSYESLNNDKPEENHLLGDYTNSEAAEFDPDHLLKLGEVIIQRLKALERYHTLLLILLCDYIISLIFVGGIKLVVVMCFRPVEDAERKNWRLKCIWEVEMRLSDCKTLSSYGSSLLPFWWHTNTQFQRINSVLDQEEPPVQEIPDLTSTSVTQLDSCIPKDMTNSPKSDSSGDGQDSKAGETVADNPSKDIDPSMSKSFEEEMDMDVEMEVDEEGVAEDSALPPPEDWIPPPPPPEEDVIPPPPMEEPPPELGPPPSLLKSYPLLPYSELGTLPYAATALDYYGPSAGGGIVVSAYYAEPQQVAEASSEVSLVTPVVWHDVSVPAPIIGSSESSGYIKADIVKAASSVVASSTIEIPTTSAMAQNVPDSVATAKAQSKGLGCSSQIFFITWVYMGFLCKLVIIMRLQQLAARNEVWRWPQHCD